MAVDLNITCMRHVVSASCMCIYLYTYIYIYIYIYIYDAETRMCQHVSCMYAADTRIHMYAYIILCVHTHLYPCVTLDEPFLYLEYYSDSSHSY